MGSVNVEKEDINKVLSDMADKKKESGVTQNRHYQVLIDGKPQILRLELRDVPWVLWGVWLRFFQ